MANLHFGIDLSEVKLLKAMETCTKKWMLTYSCIPPFDFTTSFNFAWLHDFDTFEELKVWCDLNMPGITLLIETYNDWLSHNFEYVCESKN